MERVWAHVAFFFLTGQVDCQRGPPGPRVAGLQISSPKRGKLWLFFCFFLSGTCGPH